MDRYERLSREKLIEIGAEPKRNRTHEIWGLPDGRSFTMPVSPSDVRSWKNLWSILQNLLGLRPEWRGTPGRRRERKMAKYNAPVQQTTPLVDLPIVLLHQQVKGVHDQIHIKMSKIRHPVHGQPKLEVKEFAIDLSDLETTINSRRTR